jgi:hypothetical protein
MQVTATIRYTKTSGLNGSFIEGDRCRTPANTANMELFYTLQSRLKGFSVEQWVITLENDWAME